MACAVAAIAPCANAQEIPANPRQRTAPPTNARFNIIQSEVTARWTFRLYRYTERVAILEMMKDSSLTWTTMPAVGLPPSTGPGQAHLQIFTSGLGARHTYLIDTDSGATWVLSEMTNGELGWLPIGS